jgi:signal transduction histidine kinase/ActR/RegA family two-component response regulator
MPFESMLVGEALTAALLASLSSVAVLIGLFFYLNHHTRREYFNLWGVAWLFYGLWLVLRITTAGTESHWNLILREWCIGTSAVFILWGGCRFMEMPTPQRSIALFLTFIYSWGYVHGTLFGDSAWAELPVFLLAAIASVATALGFCRLCRSGVSIGPSLLMAGFTGWGLYLATHPLAELSGQFRVAAVLISSALQLFIGISMIVLMLEEARASTDQMHKEIRAVQSEKESLQVQMISTEAKFKSLFGENELQGDLQMAYEQLRATQQTVVQQERLRALGQMASGIAHDINNSLTPIIGYSDFLIDVHSDLPADCKKYLQCIRTAAGDIAHMVEQVRQFYRRRDQDEPLQAVDVNAIVMEVIAMTRPRWRDIPQREGVVLEIKTELAGGLPQIRENQGELREAITNLVLNSVDAMPKGGVLTLGTRVLHRRSEHGEITPRVIVEVRDTGVGMDELTRQRCLEPFFTTKGPKGSGLGLAMVYGMMRRHQGCIEIDSQEGHGTIVRLMLNPVETPVAAPQPVEMEVGIPPLRILCIDDDQRIGAMLQQVLTSRNHQVEIADGGQKGVDAFRRAQKRGEPFQVVITDLGMPNVDGRQIVRMVKDESPATPVIMLTGWAAMMDQEAHLPKDVDAIVSKPAGIDQLLEVLAQVTKVCPA